MNDNKFTFPGSGGENLAARLDRPEGEIKAYALFAHCFTCGKDIKAASRIAKALNDYGIAVLRFDFTGLGMSEGEFSNTNFTSNVKDLICAADHMREELEAPQILIGHSLGGTAVLKAAGQIEEIRALVTICAPADASHVSQNFDEKLTEIKEKGKAKVDLAGRSFEIRKQFIDDIENQNMKKVIADLKTPLLILHAPFDKIVGIDNAAQIFQQAKHPKSFISLDDADHLLSRPEDSRYAASVLSAWASRYISPIGEKDSSDQSKKSKSGSSQAGEDENKVVVASQSSQSLAQDILAAGHRLKADEPENMGGQNKGPDPYSLLLASLGACTSMTLQIYARRKEWPLESVEVRLEHSKTHARDCESCESGNGKIDKFERQLVIKGDKLSDEQMERLVEIADKCPVHKTLKGEIEISTSLQENS